VGLAPRRMRFPEQSRKFFTRATVEPLRSGLRGCYGLFRGDDCLYIGKGDIRRRLLAHLEGDDPTISRSFPSHWLAVTAAEIDTLERELVREYRPSLQKSPIETIQKLHATGVRGSGR
jgi:hypothetical protein